MIQDDEFEVLVTCPERAKELGFKPQMEIVANRLLPYASELDEESRVFLEQVKTNFAKAVMLREMKPACGVWSSRLMKYVRIFGLKFSKEDHIALVKLAYELILVPDLEPCKIHKFASLFLMLTKKKHLISPEELTLPWRPLYDVGRKIFFKSASHIGMYHYLTPNRSRPADGPNMMDLIRKFLSGNGLDDVLHLLGLAGPDREEMPTSLETSYLSVVKSARSYFPLEATKEILDEFLPQVCPWATDGQPLSQLAVFLPVSTPRKHAEYTYLLWFDELMTLWDTCYNSQCGVSDLMAIFAGLAKRTPGAVDWTPHVPKMFMRFMHALNLPVSYKDMQYSKNFSIGTKHIAAWIVWSIYPDGVVMRHLKSFIAGVESYLHSANQGRWSYKLRDLLRKLAREFLVRVRREREKRFQKSWENQTPEELKLRDEDIIEFVTILLEPTLQGVYSRCGMLDISTALHDLATLRPALVVPPLIEKLQTSLTSLTEPHRVTAAMTAVAAVARPLLRGAQAGYPEGPTHVIPLLLAILPGLDPNDLKKTIVSLHFILVFSWMVPYIDCSSAHEYWKDLTDEERITCASTAQSEDFVLMFLERIFAIIESSILENVRMEAKETEWSRSKTDAVMETALSSATTSVLMQCSPRIFREALRKFRTFATDSTFEAAVSGSMVGVLLRVFARVDAAATLAAFLPDLCTELEELLSTDEALQEVNPPRELLYRLVLLMHLLECDGKALLPHIPRLLPVLDRVLRLHSSYALARGASALAHLLASLSVVDLIEWRSSPKDYGAAPRDWLPVREWGHGCLLKEADFKWHVPDEGEVKCAQELVDRYLRPEMSRLRQWLAGERNMCRERRLRSFYVINAVLAASSLLPPPDEEPTLLMESLVPPRSMPFTSGVPHPHRLTLDGDNLRLALTNLLLEVQARMLADKSDDPRGLEQLVNVWERVVSVKGPRAGPALDARMRSYSVLERALDGHGALATEPAASARLRMLLADGARLQDEARLELACDAGVPPSALHALRALLELSVHVYTSVRLHAQARLYWMLGHFPYSYRALVPRLCALLAGGGGGEGAGGGEGEEEHARHKGVLYVMLGPRAGPLVAKQDWETALQLWPMLLAAPLSEKPSIIRLEQAFGDTLHRNFPAVNTKILMPESAIEAARPLLTQAAATDPQFLQLVAQAPARERATNERWERQYVELVLALTAACEAPGVPWRRLELGLQLLACCPSVQTLYPPRAVRLMVRSLVHDDIAVRRTAQRLTHFALKQRKRPLKKLLVDPYEVAGVPRPERPARGYRPDLEWAVWAEDGEPRTDAEWDRPWLRNLTYGFYAWPARLEVAAPYAEQSFALDLLPEDMEDGERYVFEFFSDEANVERLVRFLTVEEKKGKDKFNGVRFAMFRMLIAHYGERVAERLLAHGLRCAGEPGEAAQRFAAELGAAALRAPRYWPRARAQHLHERALAIVRAGLSAVSSDTLEDWGTCLATGLEKLCPRRGARLLAGLRDACSPRPGGDADADGDASFLVCARLYALQGALGSLAWRAAPLAADLLRRLEAAGFVYHKYQNVRETVSSLLMTIFDTELVFPGGGRGAAPCFDHFLQSVLPRLGALYDENGDIVIKSAVSAGGASCGAAPAPAPAPALPRASPPPPPAPAPVPLEVALARLGPGPADDATSDARSSESPEAQPELRGSGLGKRAELAPDLEPALRLSGDWATPSAAEHARAVNLLTTVLRGCMGVVVRGVQGGTRAQYRLVPLAAALGARGPPQPHDELPRAADGFLAALARHPHAAPEFDAALETLRELAAGRSWWARLACLDFAQPLLFYGLPMFCERGERAEQAEAFALGLMADPRLEVRAAAAKLLTGLMHCRALPDEDATLARLQRCCRAADPTERHRGVLGLCAYLASRPYGLGPALGAVLGELARHTSAPDPVPATIRRALADFRRTHHDDWPRHRDALTEEEHDLLADLTSPPSYCA